jgi:hypothetical protein
MGVPNRDVTAKPELALIIERRLFFLRSRILRSHDGIIRTLFRHLDLDTSHPDSRRKELAESHHGNEGVRGSLRSGRAPRDTRDEDTNPGFSEG